MLRLSLIAAGLVALVAAAPTPVPTAPKSLVWEDLFAPPYAGLPEISMGLSCIDPTLCYLPGGSNGAGFQMFTFNGQVNGYLNPMNEPNMTMMIMATTAGGTKANPVAAFSGMGFGSISSEVQYLVNGSTWLPSTVLGGVFIGAAQCIRSTDDGKHIIAMSSGVTGNNILHSTDYGKTYVPMPLKLKVLNVNCTFPVWAAMPSNNTWYVVLGNAPNNGNSNSGSNSQGSESSFGGETFVAETFSSTLSRPVGGKKVTRIMHSAFEGIKQRASKDEKCPGYTGQIAKTTDGGQTWVNLVSETSYTFNQIDCVSETHCVAVGYGVENGITVSLIYLTTDGKTFKKVFSVASTAAESFGFQAVRFADAHEVWVGGSATLGQTNYGALWFSKDGGNTWQMYQNLQPNVVMIMDLSFTKGVGFAVAMTELKTATILRYKSQYFDGYFVQANCPFAGCTALCQNMTYPQGMCMETQGGSTQAYCDDGKIISQNYETTSCVGNFNVSTMPINMCLNSTQGGFFENYCLSVKSVQPRQRHARNMRRF